ncbi:MAG TPA: IPTL-CTERM sorting domain-containing protein [Usitatibacteraceae bacterium]|nr:IPTL-CTERM sorting domain-containing protein [Usitatibacteraceae bacterium]
MSFTHRRVAAATLCALVLATSVGPAFAAPFALPQVEIPGSDLTNWVIVNDGGTSTGAPFTGTCSLAPGLSIVDAGGPLDANDAYDNAYNLYVNGAAFVAPPLVDFTGTTMTAGPVAMSGLNVTVQYYFSPLSAVARLLYTMQNPTDAPIAATVQIPVNFGSDAGTVIETTSSGDVVVSTADRWVVSSDGVPGDSVNLTVMAGPGAVAVPLSAVTRTVFTCSGAQGLGMTYNLNVPAFASQSVMLFAGLEGVNANNNTVASATTAAALFDSNATLQADWLDGMNAGQLAQVVNWAFPAVVAAQPIPTLSELAMVVLSAMMGAVAFLAIRRRRGSGTA